MSRVRVLSPLPLNFGSVAQLVRAPACHAGGRGFEPHLSRLLISYLNQLLCGSLAQLGEHLPYKQRVTGSSPVTPITLERQS